MDLSGRRALVTGAAGGLGSVIAHSLAELGADLFLVDITDGSTCDLAKRLEKRYGIAATTLRCDLEDQTERESMVQKVLEEGGVNILINNAAFVGTSGLPGWAEAFEGQSIETWRRAIEVNLTSVFHLCQQFAPSLRDRPGANVINIASIYGQLGPDWTLYEGTKMANPAAYGASKGGLIQLTRWLATTLGPHIRVNAISPGGVKRGQPPVFMRRYEARTPLGRMANYEDFAGAIAYLASDLSLYVTGQVLNVDGGWGIW